VKVPTTRSVPARIPWRASVAALAAVFVTLLGVPPATAHAITRDAVLDRAHNWVAKKVRYSQSSTFGGYRRDCSGFVSMAWKLGRSYTSTTIRSVAKRVPLSKLKPGDAIRTPGHVAIFVKWANRARTRYVAMEQSTWGRPALRHVRSVGRGATGLRYRRITEKARVLVASAPLTGVSPTATIAAAALPELLTSIAPADSALAIAASAPAALAALEPVYGW